MAFDAGPLIYLDALGYLPALGAVYRVLIPDAVAEELERRPGAFGSGVPSLGFVERRAPAAEDVSRVASGPPSIDTGEREALALGIGEEATVAMDDRRGVRRATRMGIPVTGTLAILVRLHHLGHARRGFAEDLDALEDAGMYLTTDLRRRAMARLRSGQTPQEGT